MIVEVPWRSASLVEEQFSFDVSGLKGNPFRGAAAADHPYMSSSFQEGLAAIYYGLEYGSRILIVSAAQGIGKTTFLSYLERRLRDRCSTRLLPLRNENGREVLCKVLSEMGVRAASDDLLVVREQVDTTLSKTAKPDQAFILLLDYDEGGTGSTLDVLRNLATLESIERGLLRVVIAAGPQIAQQLRPSDLTDEIIALSRLTASEVRNYIDHRLRLVGWSGPPLFTTNAYTLIAEESSGNPSRVNAICDKLLQDLPQPRSAWTAASSDEGLLDESYVKSFIPDQTFTNGRISGLDRVPSPLISPGRRTAVLGSIVLFLLMAIGGLWYRSASKPHSRHGSAKAPHSSGHLDKALFGGGIPAQLHPTSAPAKTEAAGVQNSAAGNGTAVKPDSQSADDGHPAQLSPMGLPISSTLAPRTRANGAGTDMVRSHRPERASSSAATATPGTRQPPSAPGEQDQNVKTILPTGTNLSNQGSTSSSGPSKKTLASPARISNKTMAQTTNGGSRATKEQAAWEVRLGDAYMNLGDYDKARGSFATALILLPDSKEALDKLKRADHARAAEESVLR